jgi:hypothetical protein
MPEVSSLPWKVLYAFALPNDGKNMRYSLHSSYPLYSKLETLSPALRRDAVHVNVGVVRGAFNGHASIMLLV